MEAKEFLATKFADAHVKEDGTFEGYASRFGNTDSYRDIVAPGAFKATLAGRPVKSVKMLWQHDTHQPIGVWKSMAEDSKGLAAEGKLLLGTTMGRNAYEFIKEGAVDGLSIGFRVPQDGYDWDPKKNIRTLKQINLLEVSVVTFPANDQATIGAVKSILEMSKRELEDALADGMLPKMSRRLAKTLLSGGFNALSGQRDAAEGEETADGEAADLLNGLTALLAKK